MEGTTRKSSKSESAENKQILDNAYVVIERYLKYQELFNKIHASRYKFKARFGKEAIESFDKLREIINDILLSSRSLSRYWMRQGKQMTKKKSEEHLEKCGKLKLYFGKERMKMILSNQESKKLLKT